MSACSRRSRWSLLVVVIAGTILSSSVPLPGQGGGATREVNVYVSLDFEHASAILDLFEKETGIKVRANPDTEDNKTVGLVNKILAEGEHPIADLFWNNECGQSERLKAKGRLEPCFPGGTAAPLGFRDPEGHWTGFAARARVLAWNTTKIGKAELPERLEQLAEPRFASRLVIAKPLTGTTLTHAGVLYAGWGKEKAEGFWRKLKENGARFERGNAQVANLVAEGEFAIGLTDTDDVRVRELQGRPIAAHYLDQQEGGLGTLVIPNSVMVLKGCRHPEEAKALAAFLVSPRVEKLLAEGASAQIPVLPGVEVPPQVLPLAKIRPMIVDWKAAGDMIDRHWASLEGLFLAASSGAEEKSRIPAIAFAVAFLVLALVFALRALKSPVRGRPPAA